MVPPPAKNPKEVGTYLRYIIKRTPSLQVPVYRKWMSGGNRCIVMIKKVKGDYSKLVKDISDDLDIKAEDIRINPVTQHIEIKGDVYTQTVQWVLNAGF
jgi:large subunit ribosomal protein L49